MRATGDARQRVVLLTGRAPSLAVVLAVWFLGLLGFGLLTAMSMELDRGTSARATVVSVGGDEALLRTDDPPLVDTVVWAGDVAPGDAVAVRVVDGELRQPPLLPLGAAASILVVVAIAGLWWVWWAARLRRHRGPQRRSHAAAEAGAPARPVRVTAALAADGGGPLVWLRVVDATDGTELGWAPAPLVLPAFHPSLVTVLVGDPGGPVALEDEGRRRRVLLAAPLQPQPPASAAGGAALVRLLGWDGAPASGDLPAALLAAGRRIGRISVAIRWLQLAAIGAAMLAMVSGNVVVGLAAVLGAFALAGPIGSLVLVLARPRARSDLVAARPELAGLDLDLVAIAAVTARTAQTAYDGSPAGGGSLLVRTPVRTVRSALVAGAILTSFGALLLVRAVATAEVADDGTLDIGAFPAIVATFFLLVGVFVLVTAARGRRVAAAHRAALDLLATSASGRPVAIVPRLDESSARQGVGLDVMAGGQLLGHLRLASVAHGFDPGQPYVLLGEGAIGSTVALVTADRESVLLPSTPLLAGPAPVAGWSDAVCGALGWTPSMSATALGTAPAVLPVDGRVAVGATGPHVRDDAALGQLASSQASAVRFTGLILVGIFVGLFAGLPSLVILGLAAVALIGLYAITRRGERRAAEAMADAPAPGAPGPVAPPLPPEAARVVSSLGVNVAEPVAYNGPRGPLLDRRVAA
ncbi:MAG: hypothetical protein KDB04_15760 [Acidimicrobiales bacterium]|nr:hypothetical protein [Acidimicrobiales bacterium]